MGRQTWLGAVVTVGSVIIAYFSAIEATAYIWQIGFVVGMVLLWRGTAASTRGPWSLALARTAIGWGFIDNSQDHFRSRWIDEAGRPLSGILGGAARRAPSFFLDPPYQAFLQGIVLPNLLTFAYLIVLGELLVGLSLSLGLLTRLGAVGGMWLSLNYMLMKGFATHGAYVDKVFFLVELVCLVGAAGLAYGLDTQLRGKLSGALGWLLIGGRGADQESARRPTPRPLPT
ncbi:MAG: DoxX family membrane protein [Chloroflexi bacterium]|nr:DoxX family membrane protein [Chloroflexota bacterium]